MNAHQTDAAALQKESILESTGRKEAVRYERASNQGPALHHTAFPCLQSEHCVTPACSTANADPYIARDLLFVETHDHPMLAS